MAVKEPELRLDCASHHVHSLPPTRRRWGEGWERSRDLGDLIKNGSMLSKGGEIIVERRGVGANAPDICRTTG